MARILLIDEDEQGSRLLAAYLARAGYEVMQTVLAQEGIAVALEMSPDLILLDVILPDQTGFQACGKLREHARTQNTPIILMSGRARSASQQQLGRLMGANAYLLKPLNFNEVEHLMHRLLSPAWSGMTVIESGDPVSSPPTNPPFPQTELPEIKLERLFTIMRESLADPSTSRERT